MLRNRLILVLKNSHGNHNNANPDNLESISDKKFFKNYQQAINLSLDNKLQQANQSFRESLKEISNSNEDSLEHYTYILKRMAHNYRRLGQLIKAEQTLYDIIKHKRSIKSVPAILYDDYNNLFKHMITYDLEKALKLCKALLSRQKQQMPVSYVKIFTMNLGIAYLLNQNYEDAKKRFSQCLDADPQGSTKTYALNNLALACWWHKSPPEQSQNQNTKRNQQKINLEFKQSKQLLVKSLLESEQASKITDSYHKLQLQETLSLKEQKLHPKLQFNHRQSITPLKNIANFYLATNPLRTPILYFYNKAMDLSKKEKLQKTFDHLYVEYALLNSQTQLLIQILPNLIEKYHSKQQFSEQMFYCRMLALNLMKVNKEEYTKYLQRSQTIQRVLPKWMARLSYIAYDELNLTT